MSTCPHCRAREVLGVWLSPKRASVVEKIKRAGQYGIASEDTGINRNLFKCHVYQINILLEETDYKIKSTRGPQAVYRLEKVR